jgi:hypothetical protein
MNLADYGINSEEIWAHTEIRPPGGMARVCNGERGSVRAVAFADGTRLGTFAGVYVHAFCHSRAAQRTFRIERIIALV